MGFIEPTMDQIKRFMSMPDEGPVVMVNLLKFKPEGGRESYAKYAAATQEFLQAVGGRLLYRGRYRMPVIGEGDWDEILLVEYPSVSAFFEMMRNKGYQAIIHYRTEALIDSRLWATKRERGSNV
jgi:uncharacterized protein (DUF1330 family)